MSGPKPSHAFVASERQKRKRNLDEFAADLQTTIRKALPLASIGYRRVAVLSISWSNDTMGVKNTEQELLDVFENCYGFAVESFVIQANLPSKQASFALQKKMMKFCEDWDTQDSLTIYVYSGHGALVEEGNNKKYLIAGQANQNGLVGPSFDWFVISSSIVQLPAGDVLYIFDSCYAGQLAVGDGPELLAAANWSSVAGSILDTSFTRILAAQLKELDGSPCSVSHLFGEIHRGVVDNNIVGVPIHVPHPIKDSIILQKLEKTDETRQSKRMKNLQIGALEGSESRVLITVRLQNSVGMPDLIGWKQWLAKNIPPSVHPSQITIEGQFDIGSSLILVALPVAIWTALPADDTAYGFVSFVKSGNRLLQQVGPLAHRSQPAGRENQSPGFQGRGVRPQSFGGSSKETSSGGFSGFDGGSDAQPSIDK